MQYTFGYDTIYVLTASVNQPGLNPGSSFLSIVKSLAKISRGRKTVHKSNADTFPGPNSSSVSRRESFLVNIAVILSFGPIGKDLVFTSSFVS